MPSDKNKKAKAEKNISATGGGGQVHAVAFASWVVTSPEPSHCNNHDEDWNFGTPQAPVRFIGNFHKTLPHNDCGEVDCDVYKKLTEAAKLANPDPSNAFEGVKPDTSTVSPPQLDFTSDKLADPQAAFAKGDLHPNPTHFMVRPAPSVRSAAIMAEMAELYWMALLRDRPFADWSTDPDFTAAATEINGLATSPSASVDLKLGTGGDFPLTTAPGNVFRGTGPDEDVGPFLSQFWLFAPDFGTQKISRNVRTYKGRQTGVTGRDCDYLYTFDDWLHAQRTGKDGMGQPYGRANRQQQEKDEAGGLVKPRIISTMRDMAAFVHRDALHQAYFNAALLCLGWAGEGKINNLWSPGIPYGSYKRQQPFGTLGGPFILTAVSEVASRGLQVQWFQKWNVHRRLRPEVLGGRIHLELAGNSQGVTRSYGLQKDLLKPTDPASALGRIHDEYGSYLLPVAFSSGSPPHPAYGAGHATVAGACVTVLKAWFNENALLPEPAMLPNNDGTALLPFGNGKVRVTLGQELNKLASNVAMGRNMGGVHFRTDNMRSLKTGEQLAVTVMACELARYSEKLTNGDPIKLSFNSFGGNTVEIGPMRVKVTDKSGAPVVAEQYEYERLLMHSPGHNLPTALIS